MIATLLEIGDIHCRKSSFYSEGIKSFEEWFDKKFSDSARESTEIVIAGDFMHSIMFLPTAAAEACNLVNLFKRKASTIYVIPGNHDYGLSSYKVESSTPFLRELGVEVITEFCEYETKLGFKLLCDPWEFKKTHKQVSAQLEAAQDKEFDSVVTHWELEPMPNSSEFIDVTKLNTKTFACGHIHAHKQNPKYLGSILPNSISENKDEDQSVIRALVMDTENRSRFKVTDIDIPSFITLEKVTISTLSDIGKLPVNPKIFYKITYDGDIIHASDIRNQAKLYGIHVYKLDPIKKVSEEQELEENSIFAKDKLGSYTPVDILQFCKDQLDVTEEEYEWCLQFLKRRHSN